MLLRDTDNSLRMMISAYKNFAAKTSSALARNLESVWNGIGDWAD